MNDKNTNFLILIVYMLMVAGLVVIVDLSSLTQNQSGKDRAVDQSTEVPVSDGFRESESIIRETVISKQSSDQDLDSDLELYEEVYFETNSHNLAESVYARDWDEFVNNLELTSDDKQRVFETIVEHMAHNFELSDQGNFGLISREDQLKSYRNQQDLEESLSRFLPIEMVNDLIEKKIQTGEEQNLQDQQRSDNMVAEGFNGIIYYSSIGDIETVKAYIASGGDVNIQTADGATSPIHNAVLLNDAELVQILINAGADVNLAVSSTGASPLHRAATYGNVDAIRALVSAGADLEYHLPGYPGFTALKLAAESGNTNVVEELLALGADATGEAGKQALESAVWLDDSRMERMLIDSGAVSVQPLTQFRFRR